MEQRSKAYSSLTVSLTYLSEVIWSHLSAKCWSQPPICRDPLVSCGVGLGALGWELVRRLAAGFEAGLALIPLLLGSSARAGRGGDSTCWLELGVTKLFCRLSGLQFAGFLMGRTFFFPFVSTMLLQTACSPWKEFQPPWLGRQHQHLSGTARCCGARGPGGQLHNNRGDIGNECCHSIHLSDVHLYFLGDIQVPNEFPCPEENHSSENGDSHGSLQSSSGHLE